MAYSMTGFGRSEKIFVSRRYTVELKSVNSRYCDINIRMPRLFNFAEGTIRKTISDRLSRGKIDVYINFDDQENASTEVIVNTGLARAYASAVDEIAGLAGVPSDLSAARIANFQDVLAVRQRNVDEEVILQELCETLNLAIDGMMEMRGVEADNLVSDLLTKIAELKVARDAIEQRAPLVVAEYKTRLSSRIDEILDPDKRALYDESRLAAETAVFADKCAVDEELKRLVSHFSQAEKILKNEKQAGKKMDFLVQEINREVNTIGSKANDLEITNNVLFMKNEIEKIREQIQNLV